MKILPFLFLALFLACFMGCDPPPPQNEDFKNFQSLALKLYQDDGFLSKENIDSLKIHIKKASKGSRLYSWKDTLDLENDSLNVKSDSLVNFLNKYLNIDKKHIGTMSENFGMDLIIERSQSMEGYVSSNGTKFQTTLFDLVRTFENKFHEKPQICLIGDRMECKDKNVDLQKYTRHLNPDDLKINKRSVAGTDINAVLDTVLTRVSDDNLIVLVSDFIFSPRDIKCSDKGNRTGMQLNNLLEQQQVGIKTSFENKIKTFNNLAVLVLQFESNFYGSYFDMFDCKSEIRDSIRPYYFWFIGNELQIARLLNSHILEEMIDKYKNKALFQLPNLAKIPIDIGYPAIKGKFNVKKRAEGIILNPETDKGEFSFSINSDFSKIFRDSSYFENHDNYNINNINYKLDKIEVISEESAAKSGVKKKLTHKLIFSIKQKNIADAEINVSLKNNLPEWIDSSNTNNDSKIHGSKTFGLSYLLNGVHSAFSSNNNTSLANINFTIKKE